jgi:hypothetical protein
VAWTGTRQGWEGEVGLGNRRGGGLVRGKGGRSTNSKRKESFKRRKTNGFNFIKTENVRNIN